MIESYGISNVGSVRTSNQDRVLTDHTLNLFVVADGMGGHRHGETAAELAISTIQHYIDSTREKFDASWPFGYNFDLSIDSNRLATGIRLANRQVWRHADRAPEFSGMGTTVAAILLSDETAVLANVGDSRIYIYRNGALRQVSVDDTWISAVLLQGSAPTDEIMNHPMRNVLTQAAGSQEDVQVHICEEEMQPEDLFLICRDGLHGVLSDDALASALGAATVVSNAAERLLQMALQRGAPDNVSIVLLSYNR
jgi:protein phosphatase